MFLYTDLQFLGSIYVLKTWGGLGWAARAKIGPIWHCSGSKLGSRYVFFFLHDFYKLVTSDLYYIHILSILFWRHEKSWGGQQWPKWAQMTVYCCLGSRCVFLKYFFTFFFTNYIIFLVPFSYSPPPLQSYYHTPSLLEMQVEGAFPPFPCPLHPCPLPSTNVGLNPVTGMPMSIGIWIAAVRHLSQTFCPYFFIFF